MAKVNGSTTGTSNSKFRVVISYSTSFNATNWQLKVKIGLQVTKGDFYSSHIQHHKAQYKIANGSWTNCGWSPSGSTIDSEGLYCTMSQKTYTANYGQQIQVRAYVGYTGNSGTVYKSYLQATFSEDNQRTLVYSGGQWKRAVAYVYSGGQWKRVVPYVYSNSGWKRATPHVTVSHNTNSFS